MDRRTFLKVAGAAGAGLVVGSAGGVRATFPYSILQNLGLGPSIRYESEGICLYDWLYVVSHVSQQDETSLTYATQDTRPIPLGGEPNYAWAVADLVLANFTGNPGGGAYPSENVDGWGDIASVGNPRLANSPPKPATDLLGFHMVMTPTTFDPSFCSDVYVMHSWVDGDPWWDDWSFPEGINYGSTCGGWYMDWGDIDWVGDYWGQATMSSANDYPPMGVPILTGHWAKFQIECRSAQGVHKGSRTLTYFVPGQSNPAQQALAARLPRPRLPLALTGSRVPRAVHPLVA